MGHGDEEMPVIRCVGFITVMQRACEWVATGKVTIPVSESFPTKKETRLAEKARTLRMLVEPGLPGFATKSLTGPPFMAGQPALKPCSSARFTGLFLTRLQPLSHRGGLKPGHREAS